MIVDVLAILAALAQPAPPALIPSEVVIEARGRKGSRRIGGRGSSGKGGRYVGGRR
jgi:hypothetical protein